MNRTGLGFVAGAVAGFGMGLLAGEAIGATTTTLPPPYKALPGDVAEGMRFLGDRDNFSVHVVPTAADTETMYVAVRRDTRRIAAFFRAGDLQCYDSKFGGIPIRCDAPEETGLKPLKRPLTAYPSGFVPGLPLTGGPGWGHPGKPGGYTPGTPHGPDNPGTPIIVIPPDPIFCPGRPGCPPPEDTDGPPKEPPVVTPEPPQPAPVPLPKSVVLMLLALGALGSLKLLKFAGEYEALRAQCCGDPDRVRA